MTLRRLLVVLAIYAALLAAGSACIYARFRLHPPKLELVESVWSKGALVRRSLQAGGTGGALAGDEQRVIERVLGESPILAGPEIALAISLVPGHDGLTAELGDRIEHLTPDDLLSRQSYDHGSRIAWLDLGIGFDTQAVGRLLAERLQTSPDGIFGRVKLRRMRMERIDPAPPLRAEELTPEKARSAALAAAHYLGDGVTADGHFRYLFDAPSATALPGYNWPRHGGSTWLLAQAARTWPEDRALREAARRAASLLTKDLGACGEHRCIGASPMVDVGQSAVALFALIELVRSGIDPSLEPLIVDLAGFLRSQQRPDGEFMHSYDRKAQRPVDIQRQYVSGEAALGLTWAYQFTHDRRDLAAASAALAWLTGPAWSFFGSRYYYGEEHWTCQVMAELWADAPDRRALDFCLRWAAYNRGLQLREGETPYDGDGAQGIVSFVTPRLTPVASSAEAGIATLDVARRAGVGAAEVAALDAQVRRALALIIRRQFLPGPTHLFVSKADVYGAVPGSEVDWRLRIDYTRHSAGSMLRWLEVMDRR